MASDTSHNQEFYDKAAEYWKQVPATVDGMLGGFTSISTIDIKTSRIVLKTLLSPITQSKQPVGRGYALDCGAGIGRITKFLLCKLFDRVDMVEQNPQFLETAKRYLGPDLMASKIGQMFPVGLQDFEPETGKYDVIWVQWVLGHLTDGDFVKFFIACQKGLKPNGVIVVKENVTSSGTVETDEIDSSVTRPLALMESLFAQAGLQCDNIVKQVKFPKGLYSVFMIVLKPKIDNPLQLITM